MYHLMPSDGCAGIEAVIGRCCGVVVGWLRWERAALNKLASVTFATMACGVGIEHRYEARQLVERATQGRLAKRLDGYLPF